MVAVFTRELRSQSRVFVIAAALAFIPFFAASLPSAQGNRLMVIAAVGGYLAAIYAAAIATVLGTSVISRDLAQKRMSFYFSRPITPAALWSGKAVASLLTVFAVMFVIGAPACVMSRDGWWNAWHSSGIPAASLILGAIASLFVLSHAVATMVRSRSALIALDFVFAIGASYAWYTLFRTAILSGAARAVDVLAVAAPAMVVILAIAPVWQLARGRVDARRNHAALSTFVWTAMAMLLLVAGAYVLWVVRAPLSTLSTTGTTIVEQSGSGDWALIAGESTRGSEIAGFVNTRTGETRRTHLGLHWGFGVSRDGSTLALFTNGFEKNRGDFGLEIRPFARDGKTLHIPLSEGFVTFELAHDGSRVAVATTQDVRVYDTRSGAMLGAVRRNGQRLTRLYFASPTVVRIHGDGAIREFDLTNKSLTQTGVDDVDSLWLTVSDDGTRAYVPKDSRIIDARTGATIATLPVRAQELYAAAMMNDGRVAIIETSTPATKTLRVFDRDGRELRAIALPPLGRSAVRAQLGDGSVIVGGATGSLLVDVDRGTLGPFAKDTRGPIGWGRDVHLPRLAKDAQIVAADRGTMDLVVWDPRTGAKHALF
jgi:hypothetical protein